MKNGEAVLGEGYTGEVPIDLHERFDNCSGEGFAGWDGTPACVTIDAVDTAHVVLTVEGAYPDVDGTWDVPRARPSRWAAATSTSTTSPARKRTPLEPPLRADWRVPRPWYR